MNRNDDSPLDSPLDVPRIGLNYPTGQLAKAFVTAVSHEDAATRRRAEDRLRRWRQVIGGMADRSLSIGSRTPVAGLPAWVTPEIVRGGFATGDAAAGGPPLPYEIETARRAGIPARRAALFAYHLTEQGLAELTALLDSGRYAITLPEEGALLTMAWLLRAGDRLGALTLLDTIQPYADRLRFIPRPGEAPPADPSAVSRSTVGEVRDKLAERRPKPAIEAMREALTVWNPFADELLTHWLEAAEAGRLLSRAPAGWRERGADLLARYESLAAEHPHCTKHRKPRENISILRTELAEVVAGRRPGPPRMARLQRRVDSMVRRRGRPGSEGHAALRERQAANAARPTHHALAQILVRRLSGLPEGGGVASTDPHTAPVTAEEHRETGVPAGAAIPPALTRTVQRALRAPIETLIERGVVPSAEVLAELVPQVVAARAAAAYEDGALRGLVGAGYRAFRNRRSLLLLNLEHQVRFEELPWVRAVTAHRRADGGTRRDAHAALARLGELALQGFPGTILPNPLLRELDTLAREAGLEIPIVDELAADIFMGTFSAKFLRAAQLAGELLAGTLYERYYGVDYRAIRAINDVAEPRRFRTRTHTSDAFERLCRTRAGITPTPARHRVAANGMVIEQAQILTTHNLAALVRPVGVNPSPGWPDLARRSFATMCRLVARVPGDPYPLRTIKDAAYAWRQMIFFLSLCPANEQAEVIQWIGTEAAARPPEVTALLNPLLTGLRHVAAGGSFTPTGHTPPAADTAATDRATDLAGVAGDPAGDPAADKAAGAGASVGSEMGAGRRFLGWSTDFHWMRTPIEPINTALH